MTCNALYSRENDYATTVDIQNLYGSKSITVSDAPIGKWNSFGTPTSFQLFTKDEENTMSYKSMWIKEPEKTSM